jgi:transposase
VIPQGVQVFIALEPVDMRGSFDRLSGLAQQTTGYDARSGAVFVFYSRRRDAVKLLFFDGSGMAIFYKRLDQHVFAAVESVAEGASYVELDPALLDVLLDGLPVAARCH